MRLANPSHAAEHWRSRRGNPLERQVDADQVHRSLRPPWRSRWFWPPAARATSTWRRPAEGHGGQAREAADHALSRGDRQHRGGEFGRPGRARQGFIETINYQDGAPVKKGDLLFTIELEPYKVKLDQAQAVRGARQVVLQSGAGRVRALGRTDQAEGHDAGVVSIPRSPPATPRNPRSTTRDPTRASPRSTTNTRKCGRRSTAS